MTLDTIFNLVWTPLKTQIQHEYFLLIKGRFTLKLEDL